MTTFSIIVPLYNEEAIAESLIMALSPLASEAEVLLVDGSSSDGTRAVLERALSRLYAKDKEPVPDTETGNSGVIGISQNTARDTQTVPVISGEPMTENMPAPQIRLKSDGFPTAGFHHLGVDDFPATVDEVMHPRRPFMPGFRLLCVQRGRGNQLNAGAMASTGQRLLFLHADCRLPENAISEMESVLHRYDVGCFGVRFPLTNILMITNRLGSNLRAQRGIIFGDQGLFIRRQLFFQMGMFPDIPLMEDYQFSLTLKAHQIKTGMTRHRICASNRRYPPSLRGTLRVMRVMFQLRRQYRQGVPAEVLSDEYERRCASNF